VTIVLYAILFLMGAVVLAMAVYRGLARAHSATAEKVQTRRHWLTSTLVIRVLLLLGAFLTCVRAAMFIAHRWETFSPMIKLAVLALVTASFYLAGIVLLPRPRPEASSRASARGARPEGWAITSAMGLLLLFAGLLGLAGRRQWTRWGQELKGELQSW